MIAWEGVIGYELRGTLDGRVIRGDCLELPAEPLPIYRLPQPDAPPMLAGSLKTVDRHTLPDGSIQLWGTGRYIGDEFTDGDRCGIGLDVFIMDTVELEDGVLAITRGRIAGAHLSGNPGWPDAVVTFVAVP